MSKARILADTIADGAELADGAIAVAEVTGAAPLASPDFTGTLSLAGVDLTPTFTQLNHVAGVSSAIQTQINTKSPIAGPTFTGTATADILNVDEASFLAIAKDISETALDVFVYDTSKDSDGGAWRKRTQHTSWYNEAASSTRSSRKEFPAVAVIVGTADGITIYDGDDPDMPMWMDFLGGSNKMVPPKNGNALHMLNGIMFHNEGNQGAGYGTQSINIIEDTGYHYTTSAKFKYNGNIAERNSAKAFTSIDTSSVIINNIGNDVAMTVLPNAPIEYCTGLPVVTVAVATAAGISIIKNDYQGTVVNVTNTQSTAFNNWDLVEFTKDHRLIINANNNNQNNQLTHVIDIPVSNIGQNGTNVAYSVLNGSYYHGDSSIPNLSNSQFKPPIVAMDAGMLAVGCGSALNIIREQPDTLSGITSSASVAYIAHNYNTGHMIGNIRLATLSDTSTTNVSSGTEADRTIHGRNFAVNGTITKTVVATGADLVGYSGFTSSNFLQQSYNAAVGGMFKTTDSTFVIQGWLKRNGGTSGTDVLFSTGEPGTAGKSRTIAVPANTKLAFYGWTAAYDSSTNYELPDNTWTNFCFIYNNKRHIWYVNGKFDSNVLKPLVTYTSDPVVKIGDVIVRTGSTTRAFNGSMALWRCSSTIPSADQIYKAYEEEKQLFQVGAQATLFGSSNHAVGLAYDDSTQLLHAGTSSGRSTFKGLRRVENTTTAVGVAISASNGLVAEE